MKVGRIKDPLYEDSYLGISHLPSSHLLRPPIKTRLGALGFATTQRLRKTLIKEYTVNPRKLEHGFRRICARIPYTLP